MGCLEKFLFILFIGAAFYVAAALIVIGLTPICDTTFAYYDDPVEFTVENGVVKIAFVPETNTSKYEYMYYNQIKLDKNQSYVNFVGEKTCAQRFDLVIYGEKTDHREYTVWYRDFPVPIPNPHVILNTDN